MGVSGAYIDLIGGEGVNDGYLCEIPSGGQTNPQRYLFEEVVYVVSGEGETDIWAPGGPRQTVKWKAGAVIGPPLNTWRSTEPRHRSAGCWPSATRPVVMISSTTSTSSSTTTMCSAIAITAILTPSGRPEHIHHKDTNPAESEQKGGVILGKAPTSRMRGRSACSRARSAAGQFADRTPTGRQHMQAHISEFEWAPTRRPIGMVPDRTW